ncbi:MAG: Type 1 glutamine amidotransferase-like domain-containing protein [Eubacteriales bacterium]|nr:Type 1 glutamine amidotransferase-like domain-containing protein [Eubacteriales bacterium]
MILYLTSSPTGSYRSDGPEDYRGFNPANDMVKNLREDWVDHARCLIIAADPDAYMQNDEMRFYFEKVLKETGLDISGLDLCDGRNGVETADRLSDYDMIILGGGHVPTQNAFFRKIGLMERMKEFHGIVMGISAGSMNCAEVVYAQPELPGESISDAYQRYIEGLGLTQCNVLPHYQAVKDDMLDGRRLMEDITYSDSVGHKFYTIPDGSYLLQKNGITELHGEAYLIAEGQIRQICKEGEVLQIL